MSTSSDQFLLDLFRAEVSSLIEALSNGLVALEQAPTNTQLIEPLMRAAHSIKGAARVVGVEAGVQVAHVMEELLVAAQRGKVTLTSGHIDLLLRGVDLLTQVIAVIGDQMADWVAAQTSAIYALVLQIEAAAPNAVVAAPPVTTTPDPVASSSPMLSGTDAADGTASFERLASATTAEPVDYHAIAKSPLFEAWRHEIVTQCNATQEAIELWAAGHDRGPLCETLVRVGRGIRSASYLIGIPPIGLLGTAIETRAIAARDDARALPSEALSDLQRLAEILTTLAFVESFEVEQFVADNGEELGVLAERLEAVPQRAVMLSNFVAEQALIQTPEVAEAPSSTVSSTVAAAATQNVFDASSDGDDAPRRLSVGSASSVAATSLATSEDSGERVVRVTAQSLTRLMGLAGESLVETHWLPGFANALLKLKKQQQLASDLLEDAIHSLGEVADGRFAQDVLFEARQKLTECHNELAARIGEFERHTRHADDLSSRLYHEIIASRMRPLSDGVQGFPRMVRDLARQLGKRVQLEIEGQSAPVDRDILEKLEAPLGHLLRNALDHGVERPAERLQAGKPETGTIKISARHYAGMLLLTVSDDGCGIDVEQLRSKVVDRGLTNAETASRLSEAELLEFLFLPGFSTRHHVTPVSGRGVGLDVVHSTIHGVGGSVRLTTQRGRGATFHLRLPTTLSVIRAVLVKIAGEPYAFPHNRIDRIFRLKSDEISSLEYRPFCQVDGRNIGLVSARQLFQLADKAQEARSGEAQVAVTSLRMSGAHELCVILFSHHDEEYGLIVDEFLGEQDLVVRSLETRLGKVPNIQAAAILDDGSPALIVDLDDLRTSIVRLLRTQKLRCGDGTELAEAATHRRRVLVVDDSITVREVQRQLLSQQGYDVEVAVDGADGWNRVREESFDLIISDIDMPRMNGFEFVRAIKADTKLQRTPVIIVSYKDREEDRLRGLEVGANYYLTKSSFHDETLLDAVQELIGTSQ